MVFGVETQSWPRYRDCVTVESPLTVRQCSGTIRGDRKTEAARGLGGKEQNSVFRIGLSGTHEAPATMGTCMHLLNVSQPTLQHGIGRICEPPPQLRSSGQLMASGTRESVVLKGMGPVSSTMNDPTARSILAAQTEEDGYKI